MKKDKVFHIYCDGACQVHRGKTGSWAYVIIDPETDTILYEDSGTVKRTTSPTMELLAALQSLGKAWDMLPQGGVVLHSDSKFVLDGVREWVHAWKKRGWVTSQGKPVKQQELWINFSNINEIVKPELKWIKGHSGNRWNEYVDNLATQAFKKKTI